MNKEIIIKLENHFKERGDKLSLDCLKYSLGHIDFVANVIKNTHSSEPDFISGLRKFKSVIIYGAGEIGYVLYKLLNVYGINISAFMDTYKEGSFDSVPIISVSPPPSPESLILISSKQNSEEIQHFLLKNGVQNFINVPDNLIHDIDYNNVENPEAKRLLTESGSPQYFSLSELPKEENEAFVDCGAFDGVNTKDFLWWCKNPNSAKIYAFEPDPRNFEECEGYYKTLKNAKLFNYAVSDKFEIVRFDMHDKGDHSKIAKDGNSKIETVALDEILKDKRITFIKMDIEGVELSALKGAAGIIKQQKPKLAICVYHRYRDIWEIPEFIWTLNPNYKLYMRHYDINHCETVLYAVP